MAEVTFVEVEDHFFKGAGLTSSILLSLPSGASRLCLGLWGGSEVQ